MGQRTGDPAGCTDHLLLIEFTRRRDGMIHAMDGGLWLHRHVWYGRPMAHLVSTDRALLLAPSYAAALTNRAAAHVRLSNHRAALSDYSRAIGLLQTDGAAFAGRGRVHLAQGRPHAALRDLGRALAVAPRFAPALRARAEAYLALDEFGADKFDVIYPPTSILAEPPVAVVDGNVDAKGTRKVAEAYLSYLYSEEGQRLAAKHHYRPSKPELVPADELARLPEIELIGIDDPLFGGWAKAQPYHFGDGGIFDQVYKPAQ